MSQQDTITIVLAILSTLILTWLLLPNILIAVGLINLKNGFSGGPEDANSYWPTRIDDDLYKEMLALGFQPVGTNWEQLPFSRRFEEFVFARPGEKCFGILYPNDQIMPRRGSFLTTFETGGVVFTKNYCGGVEVRKEDCLVTGAKSTPECELPSSQFRRSRMHQPEDLDFRLPLAEVLASHRQNVNRLIAENQQLPPAFDDLEFLATQERYHHHPRIRGQFVFALWILLLIKLILMAPLPIIFFYLLGDRDPLPWGMLLVEGLVGLYVRYVWTSAQVHNFVGGFSKNRKSSKELESAK